MIMIVSQHEAEQTTIMVMDWLEYYHASYIKINGEEALFEYDYHLGSNYCFSQSKNGVDKREVNVLWYRRWLPMGYFVTLSELTDNISLNNQIGGYIAEEARVLRPHFLDQFKSAYLLTDFTKIPVNKLNVLKYAAEVGLTIPQSLITSDKKALSEFLNTHKNIIVKNISEIGMFGYMNEIFVTYTANFTESDLDLLSDRFFPSIFQQKIEKLYEIRIFYLEGTCYSMAIFSQTNEQTETDFRMYDYKVPNRNVPYKLPISIEKKIDKLMKKIGLNCGSIDMIKAISEDYYFLEINPVGQFGMVSDPCNYFLEKIVAEHLISKDKN